MGEARSGKAHVDEAPLWGEAEVVLLAVTAVDKRDHAPLRRVLEELLGHVPAAEGVLRGEVELGQRKLGPRPVPGR